MRVLMLGWEFPPHISGGLGTACLGLTRALDRQHVEVVFVLPTGLSHGDQNSHVKLIAADSPPVAKRHASAISKSDSTASVIPTVESSQTIRPTRPVAMSKTSSGLTMRPVDSPLTNPYQMEGGQLEDLPAHMRESLQRARAYLARGGTETSSRTSAYRSLDGCNDSSRGSLADGGGSFGGDSGGGSGGSAGGGGGEGPANYVGDVVEQAHLYAQRCLAVAKAEQFDVIHAHDWMTYPAGLAIARECNKPLVVHVHSTEFDRSGENVNQRVYDLERQGMHGADRVVTVSYLTRSIVAERYGTHPDKISVVYNGIDNGNGNGHTTSKTTIGKNDKVVLFLGRITMQKGPEYFIRAAKRVLEKEPNVIFVMAGSGDRTADTMDLAVKEGIDDKIVFTGFLRGREIDEIFHLANVFVMPSVSEPFGIAPLEAISHDVPVIISKTSGVSEVLTHALKVDFWDVDEIANKIIAVLRHAPLSQTLRTHADVELRRLTWDEAADKCVHVYEELIHKKR